MATEIASYSLAHFILLLEEEDDDGVFFGPWDVSKAKIHDANKCISFFKI